MCRKRCTAIVLAAGSGRRMRSATAKQFMLLGGRPVLWHSLQAVEQSAIIDDCIVVTGESDIPYVQREIVDRYAFRKVAAVVAGGEERYESVYHALCFMADGHMTVPNRDGYVFIHDGARPFLTEEILERTYQGVCRHRACVAGMPVKDTIKIADREGFVAQTPDRSLVWAVQTPQVFETSLITEAYRKLFERLAASGNGFAVTDDAMVLETMLKIPVKLVEASYGNIKITTPEDIRTAESILSAL
ncbi:2-C-methyl-D-erythritol 4-phosphate cytidylyltransferase [Acetatifactor aquisgranensis]|uniref:2-C-methyl-D-erythritol 4-phosphate cytidylyltransferase n=1 Tax=Acetatifactor aquisgranensis TaxID=2941233 RepID=UPI00203A423E|nr:2-C-methyl-D-erythritol 4-phosphate cytidylyltransferase [Acetatifactor aquisgranensis]